MRLHGFFFFQAEDGIRDADVTGVQTCALPIWSGAEATPLSTFCEGRTEAGTGASPFPPAYAGGSEKSAGASPDATSTRGRLGPGALLSSRSRSVTMTALTTTGVAAT